MLGTGIAVLSEAAIATPLTDLQYGGRVVCSVSSLVTEPGRKRLFHQKEVTVSIVWMATLL